jgi:hypothetical protein
MKNISKFFDMAKVLLFSIFFVVALNTYLFADNTLGHESIFNWFILFACVLLFNRIKDITGVERKWCYGLSFLVSFSLIIGGTIYEEDTLASLYDSVGSLICTLISFVGITAVLGAVFILIFNFLKTNEKKLNSEETWKIYKRPIIFWPIIFICYVPCFLAYFPGIFAYDSTDQTLQALGIIYDLNKKHPPLHTFIWKLFLNIEELLGIPNTSLMLYCIVQMLVMSAVFTVVIRWMINKRINNYIILFSILFFALNPTFAIFANIMTKDIYFSVCFLLMSMEILNMCCDSKAYFEKKGRLIRFAVISLLCCLFRNNMIYIYILMVPVLIIVLKKYWKKILITMLSCIVLYFAIYDGLYPALGVKAGESREMLSVPIMQLARVVYIHNEELDDTELEEIDKFIDYESLNELFEPKDTLTHTDVYVPKFADGVKNLFDSDFYNNNKKEFWSMYFRLLKQYPDDYIDAFLDLDSPSWYIDADSANADSNEVYIHTMMTCYTFEAYEDGQMQLYYYSFFERDSKLPWLFNWYEKFAGYDSVENIPLVSNLFSEATPIWIMLFCITLLLVKKKKKFILAFAPSILLWLTYLLGPVIYIRYMLPFIMLYPVYLVIALQPDKLTKA